MTNSLVLAQSASQPSASRAFAYNALLPDGFHHHAAEKYLALYANYLKNHLDIDARRIVSLSTTLRIDWILLSVESLSYPAMYVVFQDL